jgi:protein-tyrosine phosphatase
MRILFVCTGNTCRSPIAEKIFRKIIAEEGLSESIEIQSAGTFAYNGVTASSNALRVLESKGITEPHTSQIVTPELMEWSTLILTMTRSHKASLLQAYPHMAEKIYTLKEYANPESPTGIEISDPFGGSLEIYEECAREIEESLRELLKNIKGQQMNPQGQGLESP